MYDPDAIEAINFEQIATVTDRLLLRGGRVPKRRPSTNRIVVRPSRPFHDEHTVIIARKRPLDPRALVLSGAILGVLSVIVAFI